MGLENYVPLKSIKGNKDYMPRFGNQCADVVCEKNKSFQKWHFSCLECDRIAFTNREILAKKLSLRQKNHSIRGWLTVSHLVPMESGPFILYIYKTVNRNFESSSFLPSSTQMVPWQRSPLKKLLTLTFKEIRVGSR